MCPDGPLAAAFLVSMVKERSLKEWLAEVPAYPIVRESLTFDAAKRAALVKGMEPALRSLAAKEGTTLDGWRLGFRDGGALGGVSGAGAEVRIPAGGRDG